ncbi:conjugal transfer protein TraB [Alkalilimnicola ehrlichii]|uniref:Conjugal transfer protein TraB n=1 Tax=Alkalilimnicola ehrlichii TaxID=351052 RepID=A0A3E0WZZ6_9GAMM|nr:TraB/GumN family protein [Alkalilimnicola ehrlichii]RFA29025.1 conjugal transfer protein TraB [Alkalilimnicola ehrlichii]RFA38661.1 conjugal transfer protein TraB [Alkalilimnicola ehrlichii]
MTDTTQPATLTYPTVTRGDTRYTLLGTAHVSRASAEEVRDLIASGRFDSVAIELCESRYQAIVKPEAMGQMDLFDVFRQGKAGMVAASLALSAYQQRLADQFGIEPGAEMKAAIESAKEADLPVLLIDREIGTTLKRIYRRIGWWQRMILISGLIGSLFSREKVTEEEIERLKEGDVLESTFSEFASRSATLYDTLIRERDRYMAARLREEQAKQSLKEVLVVIGAGHAAGLQEYLRDEQTEPRAEQAQLNQIPPASRWPKIFPWALVALILAGFAIGFSRSSSLGWQMVFEWVVINGGLSALGAAIAGGHPLTILGAFAAAPLTSLNPTIGAGLVVASIELSLRRPKVVHFETLKQDVAHIRGWWSNRVARILLVFMLATAGSAIGTYVAGFRIFERLVN